MQAVAVTEESQVGEARRLAVAAAQSVGFDEQESGRVAIVVTELCTNLLKHAVGGELLCGEFSRGGATGIECLALDRGSGVRNLANALRDGFSTAGSAGNGLGAIARLSQATDIYSTPGKGTAVLARLVRRSEERATVIERPLVGVVGLALAGETVSGDAWAVTHAGEVLTALVADGLGHGPLAATAAHAAVAAFRRQNGDPAEQLSHVHAALKSTRGAAASIVRIPKGADPIVFAGVGNVVGAIVENGHARRMVSYNGTLGHVARTIRSFSYPAGESAVIVLASDGLATGWDMNDYPGLAERDPTVIAGVLYRDFFRKRDDVTVLAARRPR